MAANSRGARWFASTMPTSAESAHFGAKAAEHAESRGDNRHCRRPRKRRRPWSISPVTSSHLRATPSLVASQGSLRLVLHVSDLATRMKPDTRLRLIARCIGCGHEPKPIPKSDGHCARAGILRSGTTEDTMSITQISNESRDSNLERRDRGDEARGRRHSGVGCRSRQALLRGAWGGGLTPISAVTTGGRCS